VRRGLVRLLRLLLPAAAAAAAVACTLGPGPTSAPTSALPEPPADWTTVTSGAGDLRLALPPWLVAFDTTGAVFAYEVVGGDRQGIELLAEGPGTAEPQPGAEGPGAWLERRMDAPGAGVPVRSRVALPSGEAMRVDRIDRPGTPLAWRLTGYAIDTSFGTAYLLVDGPPDAWAGHEDDLARIPLFVRGRPGR